MSRRTSPTIVKSAASEASTTPAATPAPNNFGIMMAGLNVTESSAPATPTTLRDTCQRPPAIHNEFYNPYEPASEDLPADYSPYIHGQPLFDGREVGLRKLPRGKTQEYYIKTDLSVAWQASLVLHPRRKWVYFEEKWTGVKKTFVVNGKKALKQMWEKEYKSEVVIRQETVSPEPEPQIDYLEAMLNDLAPATERHAPP